MTKKSNTVFSAILVVLLAGVSLSSLLTLACLPAYGQPSRENSDTYDYSLWVGTAPLLHWTPPLFFSKETLTAQVRIVLDDQDNVQECSVVKSSGRSDFDTSALDAVERVGVFPPPPSPELREIILIFNSQDGAGR